MNVVSLGYRTDLALLQHGGTEVEDRGEYLVVRSPHNPSHWWGNFLLVGKLASPEDSGAWLERFAVTFPDASHVAIGFDGTHGAAEDLNWFSARGFCAEAATVMTATQVHEPAHANTEATLRRLDSDDDWAGSVELMTRCNEQSLEAVSYRRFVEARARTNRQLAEAGHGAWFGSFLEGRLVAHMGLYLAGPGLARFQLVETDPEFRRRGLAGSLMCHVSRYGFDELGAKTLVMVADPNYFAADLYKAVGFSTTETQLHVERRPVQ
ncbi:MAG: GNAT family N-acetyltransferase [Acidimicrobiales bacterium]|jgi:ribosomal protein S18 acetylase RimI-like enzyme